VITKEVSSTSRFRDRSVRFTATFNAPTVGVYDFAIAANTGVFLMAITTFPVYLIDQFYVSATVNEGPFVEALTADLLRVQLRRGSDGQAVFPEPIPTIKYSDGAPCAAYFVGAKINDTLIVDCLGQLSQPASLVGVATITLQVGFRMYEIVDNEWIQRYRGGVPLMA
jgi:hypothetical protein